MYRYIQKTLDWGVKVASLAVTAPATWIVATQLFSDVQSPILLFLMRVAAVFLVEGVLLSNWLLLEFDKNATPEIKARYGLTALTMYTALLVIAWRHEGPTGLVFRLALLAALIGSGWDTYVYTWRKATSQIDRSVENSPKVRRHARRLAIREAIERREAQNRIELATLQVEENALLEHTALRGQRLIETVHLEHQMERAKLLEAGQAIPQPAEDGKKKRLPSPLLSRSNALPVPTGRWLKSETTSLDPRQTLSTQGVTGAEDENGGWQPRGLIDATAVGEGVETDTNGKKPRRRRK
mgnify:CR=1 FL=1